METISQLQWYNIYYMLCYCIDELKYFKPAYIEKEDISCVNDLLAALLCNSFEVVYRNGILRKYNKVKLQTTKPRGKINVPKSISNGVYAKGKLACTVTNFVIDNDINRIIKSTFNILINSNYKSDDKINKDLLRRLHNYRQEFKNVKDVNIDNSTFKHIRNLPEWYKPIFVVCEFIVSDWIARDKKGNHRLLELGNKNRLCYIWQKYLVAVCRKNLTDCEIINKSFSSGRHIWKTDLVVRKGNRVIIADAKWYEKSAMSTDNINQVNTYESKYLAENPNVETYGILLYAGDTSIEYPAEIMDNGKTVTEYIVNVNQHKKAMEDEIVSIIKSYL